ncbi:putative small auxin-up RNA [Helianthus debilis subsp. tardiflorus]
MHGPKPACFFFYFFLFTHTQTHIYNNIHASPNSHTLIFLPSSSSYHQKMARSKLTKLKSVLKKWQSLGKRCGSSSSSSAIAADYQSPNHCHAVYVGKSRRRYYVSSEVAEHPVFQELVERSGDRDTVDCEVVLFEHLLWMLENADPQPDSLEELVDLYAC